MKIFLLSLINDIPYDDTRAYDFCNFLRRYKSEPASNKPRSSFDIGKERNFTLRVIP